MTKERFSRFNKQMAILISDTFEICNPDDYTKVLNSTLNAVINSLTIHEIETRSVTTNQAYRVKNISTLFKMSGFYNSLITKNYSFT